MINWTWQDTFDVMTTILVTDYCCTALYLAIPQAHVINIITWLIEIENGGKRTHDEFLMFAAKLPYFHVPF